MTDRTPAAARQTSISQHTTSISRHTTSISRHTASSALKALDKRMSPSKASPTKTHSLYLPKSTSSNTISSISPRRLARTISPTEKRRIPKTGIPSPVKKTRPSPVPPVPPLPSKNARNRSATIKEVHTSKMQPLNLPPLNVQALSTPTIQRVNDMSQRIKESDKEGKGFFGRLSRASSFRKSRAGKREEVTPEKERRRLSISWKRGMSPFHSAKIDDPAPPMPKSFTSESLVSQEPLLTPPRSSSSLASTTELADEEMKKSLVNRKGSSYLVKAQSQLQALEARAQVVSPVEIAQAPLLGGSPLNLYEKGEVIDYDGKIYFTGQRGLQKSGGKLEATNKINFGYDDERGDYIINPGDHFAYRYEIVDVLGKGSFGQVLRCIDYRTGGLVAVKVIRNKKRFHAQALVEVNILQRLREWDPEDVHHLIKYTDHFYFRHHLCIATDLLGMNLYEYIKVNDFKGCTLNVIRSFTSQILSCLSLLNKQRVIHCDLKPENILLVNAWESKIKIIDFGSSCFEDQKVYTYIQSRFYRSPEVILGMSYGLPIDIWSMGCILAELLTGYPLFPGEDEQEQLSCIMEVFGPPEKHLIENSTRKKLFFDSVGKPRSVVTSKGRRRKPSTKTLSQAIKCQDEAFLDFLSKCLRWNPQSRLTPDRALEHPFITGKSMRAMETPAKKKLFSSTMTPRPLPTVPKSAGPALRVKTYRNASGPMMSKDQTPGNHRRVVSNLPVPRDRVVT